MLIHTLFFLYFFFKSLVDMPCTSLSHCSLSLSPDYLAHSFTLSSLWRIVVIPCFNEEREVIIKPVPLLCPLPMVNNSDPHTLSPLVPFIQIREEGGGFWAASPGGRLRCRYHRVELLQRMLLSRKVKDMRTDQFLLLHSTPIPQYFLFSDNHCRYLLLSFVFVFLFLFLFLHYYANS